MDKEQLQANIAAQKLLVKSCKENHRQAESDLALLEAEVVEEPKLRHGGTGKDRTGNFILIDRGALWEKVFEKGKGIASSALNKKGNARDLAIWASQLTGSTFDDLKAMQEDMAEFRFPETSSAKALTGTINPFTIMLKDEDGHVNVDLKDLPAIIRNFQAMYATQLRERQADE